MANIIFRFLTTRWRRSPITFPVSGAQVFVGLVGLFYAAAILTQSPIVSAAIVIGSVVFVLALRWPVIGLYLMILSVPGQDTTSVSLGSSHVTLTQLTILLTIVTWLTHSIIYRKPLVPRPTPLLMPFFLVLVGVMIASMLVATSINASLAEISRWLITIFAYLVTCSIIQTRKQFWWLVFCLMLGGVLEGFFGILQSQFNLFAAGIAVSTDTGRAVGTFVLPNPYAAYLEHSLTLIFAVWLIGWRIRKQATREWLKSVLPARGKTRRDLFRAYAIIVLLGGGLALCAFGVLNSQSIGAWMGVTGAAIAMVLVRGRKSTKIIVAVVGVVFIGYLGLQTGLISTSAAERLSTHTQTFLPFDVTGVRVNDDNYAVVERMAMWQAGGNMFLSDPWLGVGIGNFDATYNKFNMPGWIYSRGHAHNYYINIAAECGILGEIAYLALMLTAFVNAWKTYRRTRDWKLKYVAWGGLGILTSVMVHNLVENLHVLNMGIQWSAVLALYYIIPRLDKNLVKEDSLVGS